MTSQETSVFTIASGPFNTVAPDRVFGSAHQSTRVNAIAMPATFSHSIQYLWKAAPLMALTRSVSFRLRKGTLRPPVAHWRAGMCNVI